MIRTIVVERWSRFERLLPNDLYIWAKAILLALVAIQAARLLWVLVTPVGPFGEWKPAQARLLPPAMQTALVTTVDPFFRGSAVPAAAAGPEASTAGLKLFGVRAGPGGSAIIGTDDGEQNSYLVGDEVAPGIRLAGVAFDYVTLDVGGREQRLAFEDAEAVADAPPGASPAAAASAPAGGPLAASAIRRAVQFAPRTQGGRVTGVLVSPGGDGASFRSIGFQPGDVIVAVNGARITSATDVSQLQSGLAPGSRLSLTIERGANTVPVALNIAGN